MTDPLQAILQAGNLPVNSFPVSSRYYRVGTATLENPDGSGIIYLKRRIIPSAETLSLLAEHQVKEADRLDNITAAYIGDPEQFWRLCDANRALHPRELEQFGRKLRITLPEGVPGMPNA